MKLSEAIAALESGQIVRAGQRVLCALSGGADSVALAHILRSAADAQLSLCQLTGASVNIDAYVWFLFTISVTMN